MDSWRFGVGSMPILPNPKHEAFAQALARGSSAAAAYVEAGYKDNRHNAATLARKQHILTRVGELQEEQLAIHQQATAQAAANRESQIGAAAKLVGVFRLQRRERGLSIAFAALRRTA